MSEKRNMGLMISDDPVKLGRLIVELHEQDGLDFELSLEMAAEENHRVSLLGLVSECARRNMSKKFVLRLAEQWAKLFVPNHAERLALQNWGIDACLE